MKNLRLEKENIKDLLQFGKDEGLFTMDEESALLYCSGKDPLDQGVQTYGIYENEELVAIMTATYQRIFPHEDNPHGRTVQLSGAFTTAKYRHRGYASKLLEAIEKDAKTYFRADYICCDSSASELYYKNGFILNTVEDRMWKPL